MRQQQREHHRNLWLWTGAALIAWGAAAYAKDQNVVAIVLGFAGFACLVAAIREFAFPFVKDSSTTRSRPRKRIEKSGAQVAKDDAKLDADVQESANTIVFALMALAAIGFFSYELSLAGWWWMGAFLLALVGGMLVLTTLFAGVTWLLKRSAATRRRS